MNVCILNVLRDLLAIIVQNIDMLSPCTIYKSVSIRLNKMCSTYACVYVHIYVSLRCRELWASDKRTRRSSPAPTIATGWQTCMRVPQHQQTKQQEREKKPSAPQRDANNNSFKYAVRAKKAITLLKYGM